MKYILIFAMFAGDGPAVSSAEFYSRQTCEAAAQHFKEKFGPVLSKTYVACLEK
jgi:hypothetical protein